jgi:deazaflavin-dependent oxidoreductase (nitroreductase family)
MAGYRPQIEKTALDRVAQAFAKTRLGGRLYITVIPIIDRWLIRRTGGKVMFSAGQPILLLHTRGAKSGQPRQTPLLYTPDGDGYVVVASKAGAVHHPSWFHNLKAHPDEVVVEVGGQRVPVRVNVAEGAERDRLWALVNDNYNGYDVYQERAGERVIPVVRLEPAH